MQPERFYARAIELMKQAPAERHAALLALHREVLDDYLPAVERITAEQAAQRIDTPGDPRTLLQIVGHMAAWEQFGIQAGADILAGVERPRAVSGLKGFVETDGRVVDFDNTDAFNAYMAEKHSTWAWEEARALALDQARTLYQLFAHPDLLDAQRLEQTLPHRIRLYNGHLIEPVRMGWVLWLAEVQHLAIEHRTELNI